MADTPIDERPIVQISKMCVETNPAGRGKKQRAEARRWVVYGVDAEGVERIYVEHTTEEDHQAWRATDPLWRQAQSALIGRLLRDPRTQDLVLQLNIKGALDAGDTETAVALARHLSPEWWHRLTGKDDARAGNESDARDG